MGIKYKNSDILSVPNVASLFTLKNLIDNQLVQTQGYSIEGVGANLYRYDSGSSSTIDGGFVLPGPGGSLSFSGTTFNGNAGDGGRFIAVDQTKIDVCQAGCLGDNSTSDSAALYRALSLFTNITVNKPGTYNLPSWTEVDIASRKLTVACVPGVVFSSDGATTFIRCGTAAEFTFSGGRVTGFLYGFSPFYNATGVTRFEVTGTEIDTCERGICDAGTFSGTFGTYVVRECHVHDCEIMGIACRATEFSLAEVRNNRVHDVGGNYANVYGIVTGSSASNASANSMIIDGNVVYAITSTVGSGTPECGGIHTYCDYAKVTSNTVSDVDATFGTDCEGIYAKIRWGIISGNIIVNAGERGEGFLTVKGEVRDGVSGTQFGYQTIISENTIVANRTSTTNNTGIYIAIADALVCNNTIDCDGGSMYRGIALAEDNCTANGNKIRGLTSSSLAVLGITTTFSNVSVINNDIWGLTSSTSGGIIGVYLQSQSGGVSNAAIRGNRIRSLTGGSGMQAGIAVNRNFALRNVSISNNMIFDCSRGIDFSTGTATVTNCIIDENQVCDLDRASLLVCGIWLQGVSHGTVRGNMLDTLNADDTNLDCRGIYILYDGTSVLDDIECSGNTVKNLSHSTNAARARSTYIQASSSCSGMVFSSNTVIDSGIGYHNSGISNISGLVYEFNRSVNNTTDWSSTTFAADARVFGNTADSILQFPGPMQPVYGVGDPNGVVTAPISTIFSRTDGGAGTTLYIKESGSGNTGWIPK